MSKTFELNRRTGVMREISSDPMYVELAEWFFSYPSERLHTHREIGLYIKAVRVKHGHYRGDGPVLEAELHRWIKNCRRWLEINRRVTLWNVPAVGYQIANPMQTALMAARNIRRTLLQAERSVLLQDITDRRLFRGAMRSVFLDNDGRVRRIGKQGRKYLKVFASFLEEPKVKAVMGKVGRENGSKKKKKNSKVKSK